MYKKSITKEEVKQLQPGRFTGEVMVLDHNTGIPNEVVQEIKDCHILGFDTETRPSFKRGRVNKVALLQLATKKRAYLIRCSQLGLPGSITKLLQDPNIVKVGVAIREDLKALQKLNEFKPDGFIELQEFVNQFGIESNGLRGIAGIVLKRKISKSQQLSNWENDSLSDAQVQYAATDAWACHEIYRILIEKTDD
jgi:ribonuclease D